MDPDPPGHKRKYCEVDFANDPNKQVYEITNKVIIIRSDDGSTLTTHTITSGSLEIHPAVTLNKMSSSMIKNEGHTPCSSSSEENCPSFSSGTNDESSSLTPLESDHDKMSPITKAMGTSIVISNIAKYFPSQYLPDLRLVNKAWNTTVLYDLKKHLKPIHLTRNNFVKFLSDMSNGSNPIFTKYHLHNLSFHGSLMHKLFEQYGSIMTHLKITMNDNGLLSLSQFQTFIVQLTPNLIELHLHDDPQRAVENESEPSRTSFWSNGKIFNHETFPALDLPNLCKIKLALFGIRGLNCQEFFTDLFNATINLEHLDCTAAYRDRYDKDALLDDGHHDWYIMNALKNKSMHLNKLKVLKIEFLNGKVLELLIELSSRSDNNQLGLSKFVIKHLGYKKQLNQDDLNQLHQFLVLQAKTLKSLSIDFECEKLKKRVAMELQLQLPIMKCLQKLKVELYCRGINIQFVSSASSSSSLLSWIQTFPSLTQLTYINVIPWSVPGEITLEQIRWNEHILKYSLIPHPKLQQLKVNYINNLDKILNLVQLFPNLTNLDIGLGNINLLSSIWSHWASQLQVLSIYHIRPTGILSSDRMDADRLDELFTGIPQDSHESLTPYFGENSDEYIKLYKTKPGISELKNLQKLKLKIYFGEINDFCIYFGIAALKPNLKYLQIYNAMDISSECRAHLEEMFGSDRVEIHD